MGLFSKRKEKSISIYSIILAALDERGRLPLGFSLPDDTPDNKIRFAPGAMDGISIFHSAGQDADEQAGNLALLLEKACKRFDNKIREEISEFLHNNHALSLVDPLIDRIREGKTAIAPKSLYNVGYGLMTEAGDAESVKLGIAMTGMLNIQENEACRKAILTLGKCDEFTLYSLVALSGWDDGNYLVWRLAKETAGWGKIHAVERLEPETEEIREWIIRSGCENGVLNSYLGLTCAVKGDLVTYLQREELPEDLLRGAGVILSSMLDEGPTAGISAYGDAERAIAEYLRHADKGGSLELLHVVLALQDWLEDSELDKKEELLDACNAIASKPFWPELVLAAIAPGNPAALWQACFVAEQIGLEIIEPLYQLIESAPLEYASYARNICRSPEYAEKLFRLYEKSLPLDKIATGMGDLMGLGPEFKAHGCLDSVLQEMKDYPGQGVELIKAGLGAPVTRCRNMALNVLEAWTAQGKALDDFDPGLRPLLGRVRTEEVNDGTRDKLTELLS